MASRKEQKALAKQQRLAAQAAREAAEKKARVIRWSAAGLALLIVVVGALVLTMNQNKTSTSGENVAGVAEANALVGGLAQKDMTVGDTKAKVTIREFADLRCPVCKQFADTQYKELFDSVIRPGKAKLQFDNWAILGEESTLAAKAALAAGEQNKGFLFADIFYHNQKNEAIPYVDDAFLTSIARAAGLDIAKWNKDRQNPKYDEQLAKIAEEATNSGFSGTPSFIVVDSKGNETPIPSGANAQTLIAAVEQAR